MRAFYACKMMKNRMMIFVAVLFLLFTPFRADALQDMGKHAADLSILCATPLYTYDIDTIKNIVHAAMQRNNLIQAIRVIDDSIHKELLIVKKDNSDLSQFNSISKEIRYRNLLVGHIQLFYKNPYDFILTPEEKKYLATHTVVKFVTDPSWAPIEFVDEKNRFMGISNDLLQIIKKKTGLEFEWVRTGSWVESMQKVDSREAELFLAISKNKKRAELYDFTAPYLEYPVVMITTQKSHFINSLDDLSGKKAVVTEGYCIADILASECPNIKLGFVKNIGEGLKAVAEGKAYTYVEALPVATYNIGKNYGLNLKIAGKTKYTLRLAMATYKGNSPELLSIIDKAIASISKEQKQQIYNRWISVQFEQRPDYSVAWKVFFSALTVLLFFFYWNRKISAINRDLDEQRQIFRTIYEKSADAILLIRDGVFVDCNEAAVRMLRYGDKEQFLGNYPADLSPEIQPDGQDSVLKSDEMIRLVNVEGSCHFEWVHKRADGETFWTDVVYTRLLLDKKPTVHVRWLDIQEQKEMQVQLLLQKERAVAASQAKSEFLANMSHEIRTPMNAVLGMLYLASKTKLTPSQRNYLRKAQSSAHSLLSIINSILDFSKIEAGKLNLERTDFQLEAVLEDLKDSIGVLAEKKNIEFLISYDMNIPSLLVGDPVRLGQVLLNLCSNAVKFTEVGEVVLSLLCLKVDDSGLVLKVTVRDTGIGMDEETRQGIFSKFTQADQSITRRFGGTGLGLAICKALVEMMGGQIWIEESEPDRGTTICCTVCLEVAGQASRYRTLLTEADSLLRNIRVLVVDDNPAARAILVEILESLHLKVKEIDSGISAIDELKTEKEHPVDLVLMDWSMPDLDGDETAQRIYGDPEIICKPKVVLLAPCSRGEAGSSAEQVGIDAVLLKPVFPSILLDTILSVLERENASALGDVLKKNDEMASAPDYSGSRLLLVEDNEINREFVRELLASMHINVDEAVNGEQAVAMVQSREYDLILMDIQMPVMDGLEATRRIRELARLAGNERFATLPVIALTAMALAGDSEKCLQAGATSFITKPLDPEQLIAVLGNFLHPSSQSSVREGDQRDFFSGYNDLLAFETLNAREGIHRIGGNVQAYVKQLQRFRDHYTDAASQLKYEINRGELQSAAEHCHGLKGVFGNIGASALFNCASEINEFLRQKQIPPSELLAQLESLLARVIDEINTLAVATFSKRDTEPLEREELKAKLIALKSLLKSDLGAANELMAEIQEGTVETAAETVMMKLLAKIDVFAVDEAIAMIDDYCRQVS